MSDRDNIGPQVLTLGAYDLVVSEALWRLCDPSDVALDVGANIGCMTAVFLERALEVYSFEPHPALFGELETNIATLKAQGVPGRSVARQIALGAEAGRLPLMMPADFELHRGESHLSKEPNAAGKSVEVGVETLDQLFPESAPIGVMKVDVEGFECDVFSGAKNLLISKRIRDVVFEEHRTYPSEGTALLESFGYRLFRLARRLHRPVVLAPDSTEPRSAWEATSFLATTQPRRAMERMNRWGWRCLGW